MQLHPPTLIVRHRRENLQKCSLRGLEGREDLKFFAYPFQSNALEVKRHVMLVMEGAPLLTSSDAEFGILLIDSTWRYLPKIVRAIDERAFCEKRVLPFGHRTAYPRKQEECVDKERGLASIEALFIAYHILGRNVEGLLDNYHWKEDFLKKNNFNI